MSHLEEVLISSSGDRDIFEEINNFNDRTKEVSFSPGDQCVLLGFLGMEDQIVIASKKTGRVGVFTYDENIFLID